MRSSTTRFDLKLHGDDKKIVARAAALMGTTMAGFALCGGRQRAIRSARAPVAGAAGSTADNPPCLRSASYWWIPMHRIRRRAHDALPGIG